MGLPDNAVDWRNEPGKIQVDLRGLHCRFRRLNRCFGVQHCSLGRDVRLDSIVKVLLAGGLLFGQRRVLVYVELSLELGGFRIGELCLSLN